MAQIGSYAKEQGGNASALMIGAGTYSGTASTWYFCKEEGLSVETFASPILETNFQPQKVKVSKRNVKEENELKTRENVKSITEWDRYVKIQFSLFHYFSGNVSRRDGRNQ